MIVRIGIGCGTCEQVHVVRIGMGQEETQSHVFPCDNCKEEITVGLEVDYTNTTHSVVLGENAEFAEETPKSPIINVDANFLIPSDLQGKDMVFPRLEQMKEQMEAAGGIDKLISIPISKIKELGQQRPYRRPDHQNEWQLLKKVWSLTNRGKIKLAQKRMTAASATLYPNEPISSLSDWVWRLALNITQPYYDKHFLEIIDAIKSLHKSNKLDELLKYYESSMKDDRAKLYFDLMKEYFGGYSEFGQTLFRVSKGITWSEDMKATSVDFDKVKMFYGNAFEVFTSNVDILAYLNNILAGRSFDTFERLTQDGYLKLDKSSRCGPFQLNQAFIGLCKELDNQIRNASHHKSFNFDAQTQLITFKTGKGGQGPLQEMPYALYLHKCSELFLQNMVLLRIELIVCNQNSIRPPI